MDLMIRSALDYIIFHIVYTLLSSQALDGIFLLDEGLVNWIWGAVLGKGVDIYFG